MAVRPTLRDVPLPFDYDPIPYNDLLTDGTHSERLSLGLDVSLGLYLPVLKGPVGPIIARANAAGAMIVDTSGTAGAGTTRLVDVTGTTVGTPGNPVYTAGGAASAARTYMVNNAILNANGQTADINVSTYTRLMFLLYNSAVAAAGNIQYVIEVKGGAEAQYYPLYTSPAVGGAIGWTEQSIGPGLELNKNIGDTLRVRWIAAVGWAANAVAQTVFIVLS